jgi:hypothetical protein
MALRRKRRNRLHRRGHVLEVKLSATQRRRNRFRAFTYLFAICAAVFGALFVAWRGGELLLRRTIYENKAFMIRRIVVDTDGVLSTEQICAWAGVRAEANLMALDLARVKRDLELVPAIESAAVERILPGTLRIRVIEREPIARVIFARVQSRGAYTNSSLCLDANGYFMFPVEPAQRNQPAIASDDHLPILAGIPAADMRPGRQADSAQVRAALMLIQAFQRSSMAGLVDLRVIDVSQPGVLVVATGQENEITFGLADFETQLGRWRLVHEHARRAGKHILTLDLAVANNAPMLWEDAAGVAPPSPKPIKPSPYKKKHV